MPQYAYRAIGADGRRTRGEMSAASESDLFQRLQEGGLELLSCRQASERRGFRIGSVSTREILQVCIHMRHLQLAGVPLLESLADIRDAVNAPRLRNALSDIHRDVSQGTPLSAAFGRHPRLFNFVFVSLIAAGEETGNLAESFDQIGKHLKWVDDNASKVRKAIRFPLFSLAVAFGVVVAMMTMVVPQVLEFLQANNAALPVQTRALVATSAFFVEYWYLAAGLPFLAFVAVRAGMRSSVRFAFAVDRLVLAVPLLGEVVRKTSLSRFSHFFAVMFSSGIPILRCLESAQRVVGNRVLADSLARVRQGVQTGETISSAMRISDTFPKLVVRMVGIGESTGKLSEALEQITEFYDRDVDDTVQRLIGAMEPTITAVVGAVLLWVALAVLGPIFDFVGGSGGL